ncbi:MAG: hypothetical protein CL912_28685 [Deltaproteobacteria bacterium]|nr:hypothetical protein [Deltaproteobacteria bacterium]
MLFNRQANPGGFVVRHSFLKDRVIMNRKSTRLDSEREWKGINQQPRDRFLTGRIHQTRRRSSLLANLLAFHLVAASTAARPLLHSFHHKFREYAYKDTPFTSLTIHTSS